MIARTCRGIFALLFWGSACSEGIAAQSSTSLLGDWLLCENADCSEVSDDGYRFLADGTVLRINGEDTVVSAAPLCIELEELAGAYQFDGQTLTMEGFTLKAELTGDVLTVYDVPVLSSNGPEGVTTARLRRVVTYEGSPCPR